MSLSPEDVDFGGNNQQNIIYVTEQQATEWTREATQELIRLYDEKLDLLEKGLIKTKRNLYEIISSDMTKSNFYYAPSQCENKWKSLKRGYLTRLEKNPNLIHTRPKLFEKEVAEMLQKERRHSIFRKRPDISNDSEMFEVDLNQPPGFDKDEDQDGNESDKDVKRILMEDNIEPESDEHSYSAYLFKRKRKHSVEDSTKNTTTSEGYGNTEVLFTEDVGKQLFEIRKIIKRHCSESSASAETLSRYLDKLNKSNEENLQLKKVEIEKQSEIIQQMKIQNSLIAKLIQKLV